MPRKTIKKLRPAQPYLPDTSPFELLPLETKLQILSHLPRAVAFALAVVSRSWRDPAESVIWSKLSITFPRNQGTSVCETSPRVQNKNLENKRMERINLAFRTRPERIGWVRELRIEPDGDDINHLVDLVEKVGPNLTELRIGPLDQTTSMATDFFAAMMKNYDTIRPFPRLKQLEIGIHKKTSIESQFSDIVHLAPTLTKLTVSGTLSRARRKIDESHWPSSIPTLTRIRILDFEQGCIPLLAQIARSASELTEISIQCKDHSGSWMDDPFVASEDDLKLLRGHEGLRKLEWRGDWQSRYFFERICEDGFDKLEMLVQSEGIGCESETYIENIHVPPFPSLHTILIPCRSTKWYNRLNLPDWAKAPPPRFSISSHTISQLRQASSLLQIQFISSSSSSSSAVLSDAVAVEEWCNKRVNGVLVRSYTHKTTGEEMFHLKRLALKIVQPKIYNESSYQKGYETMKLCTGTVTGTDHDWIDHTSYRGYPIPEDILKRVYHRVKKEKGDWITPGRGLDMPEEAWEVLRRWRGKLPDDGENGTRVMTRSMRIMGES